MDTRMDFKKSRTSMFQTMHYIHIVKVVNNIINKFINNYMKFSLIKFCYNISLQL